MTQPAYKTDDLSVNTTLSQPDENLVTDALSSIRGVIRENLERGFEHFLDKHKSSADEGAEAVEDKTSILTLQPGAGNLGTPLDAAAAATPNTDSPRQHTAEIFYLTNVLEADGSVTKLEKKEATGMTTIDAPQTESTQEAHTTDALKLSPDLEIPAPTGQGPEVTTPETAALNDPSNAAASETMDADSIDALFASATPEEGQTETQTPIQTAGTSGDTSEDATVFEMGAADTGVTETLSEVASFISEAIDAQAASPESETSSSSSAPSVAQPVMQSATPSPDLASKETMAASAAAFSTLADVARQLATTQQSAIQGATPVQAADVGSYTVEALMRELLRPMLKDWLDAHLPSLVKWLVTEQIEKMLNEQMGRPSTPSSPPSTTGLDTAA